MAELDWVIIQDNTTSIGAVGFIGDEIALITAFFDDRDGNRDGKVSIGERIATTLSPIKVKGMAVTEVAMAARFDERVYLRDDSIDLMAQSLWLHFAKQTVVGGAYVAWLSFSVQRAAGSLAPLVTGNLVKQFVIKKGMQSAVKAIWNQSF